MDMQNILSTQSRVHGPANELALATDACFDCAEACRDCADACLREERLDGLRNCIQMNLDCADVCFATGDLAIRRVLRSSKILRKMGYDERIMELMLNTCTKACRRCGDECMRHAERHNQCRTCAQVCRSCEEVCHNAARALRPRSPSADVREHGLLG